MAATTRFVIAVTRSSALVHPGWYGKPAVATLTLLALRVSLRRAGARRARFFPVVKRFCTVAVPMDRSSALACPRRHETYYYYCCCYY